MKPKSNKIELPENFIERLGELKKPVIIEVCGTPKAGKTISIEATIKYFHRNGIRANRITERASLCPIENKKDPSFNLWTGCSIITNLLESLEQPERIVIFDRGIFDTLIWMNIYLNRGQLSEYEFSRIEKFFLDDRFINEIQIVVALITQPNESLRREFKDQITDIPGSIMNEPFLNEYNQTLLLCVDKYKDKFKKIYVLDTTHLDPINGVEKIANEAIESAKQLLDERIAVVPRSITNDFQLSNNVITDKKIIIDAMRSFCQNAKWLPRTEAEESPDYVQLIPVSVFYQNNNLLVITNRGYRHGRMADHIAIWAGGHTRIGDDDGPLSLDYLRKTLNREMNEELHIPNMLDIIPKYPEALIWDTKNSKSSRHLGIFYKVNANKLIMSLNKHEYHESASKSIYSEFISISNLKNLNDWESWSKMYLHALHNIDFPDKESQLHLY